MKKNRKMIKSVVILLAVICIFAVLMIKNRVLTINSVQKINDDLYRVDYLFDYELEKVLEKGISSDNELENFISEEMCFGYPVRVAEPNVGGSFFSARSYRNEQISGRNFDLEDSAAIIVQTNPKGGFRSIAIVQASSVGMNAEMLEKSPFKERAGLMALPYAAVDGINEKGVYVTVTGIDEEMRQSQGKIPITATIALRMILDKCGTVEDAKAMLRNYNMRVPVDSSYRFFISDNEGDCTAAEYIDGNIKFDNSYAAADINSEEDAFAFLSEEKSEDKFSAQMSVVYNQKKKIINIALKGNYEKLYSVNME